MNDRAIPALDLTLAAGNAAAASGDWVAAEQAFRTAHDVAEANGARMSAAVALSNAGQAALRRGALDDADALLSRALDSRAALVRAGSARGAVLARAIGDLAVVRHARGATEEAAALLARAAESAADGDPALAEAYRRDLAAIAPERAASISLPSAPSAPVARAAAGAAAIELASGSATEAVIVTTVAPTRGDPDLPLLDLEDAPAVEESGQGAPEDESLATLGLPMLDVDAPTVASEPVAHDDDPLAPLDLELELDSAESLVPEAPPVPPAAALLDTELDAELDAVAPVEPDTFAPGEPSAGTTAPTGDLAPVAVQEAQSIPSTGIAGLPTLDALPLMNVGDVLELEPAPDSLDALQTAGFEPTAPVDETPVPAALPALDLDSSLALVDDDAGETAVADAPAPAGLERHEAELVPVADAPADGAAQTVDGWIPDAAIAGAAARDALARTSAALEELAAATAGAASAAPHGFDLDAMEQAGATSAADGVRAATPRIAPPSDADELAFLRTPAGGIPTVSGAAAANVSAEAPIEDVLAALDVELGIAPAAPRKPLAPPAPDAPRRDEPAAPKPSWWRRLRQSAGG